jgi:hypothetical protein
MGPVPPVRLYLQIFADGRGEYEANRRGHADSGLAKHNFRVTAEELSEIIRLGEASRFQKAKDSYPAYRHGIDSSTDSAVAFRSNGTVKKINLKNYYTGDREVKLHYPTSLIALMERAELIRERAMGIVRPIPAISFCELLRDREAYAGKKVSLYADIRSGETLRANLTVVDHGETLTDHECTADGEPDYQTMESLYVEYAGDEQKRAELRRKAITIRERGFDGRARVTVVGVLRKEPAGDGFPARYIFDISEIKSMKPIILPFQGRLQLGWTYTDTIDFVKANGLTLSQLLKMPYHQAGRIEWDNTEKLQTLQRSNGRKHIVFRCMSSSTQKVGERWDVVYRCEIVELLQ